MIIHCSQCGENQPAPATFCRKCGSQFTAKAEQGQNVAWIGTIAAIAGLLLLAYYLTQNFK